MTEGEAGGGRGRPRRDRPGQVCPGAVHLVGAGPGDPELLTLKAARLLGAARTVVHDRLVDARVLDLAAPGAELVFVGKRRAEHSVPQPDIGRLLVERAWRGERVVRLKGGDPLIFGRAAEELAALVEAGVPFEVVPGVTAAAACAAAATIPLTHRDHARTLVLATGHAGEDGEPDLDWPALCRPRQTLVLYMGRATLPALCAGLVGGGLPAATPAAVVENGTLPGQRVVRATLADLPARAAAAGTNGAVALVVVGEVVAALDAVCAAAARMYDGP